MEPDFVKDAMWGSAEETFSTMVPLPIEKTDQPGDDLDSETSLTCTITFSGQILGGFSIQCPLAAADQMAKAMMMMEPDETIPEQEICDR